MCRLLWRSDWIETTVILINFVWHSNRFTKHIWGTDKTEGVRIFHMIMKFGYTSKKINLLVCYNIKDAIFNLTKGLAMSNNITEALLE